MKDKQKKQPDPKPGQKENPSSPKDKNKEKKQKKGEEIDLSKVSEPVTERVRKKVPRHKPLGPSGQDWDI